MRALLAGARRKQPQMLDLVRQLVQAESPSNDKAAVDACVALAAAHAKMLGGRVKLHRQRGYGDLLEARFGPKPGKDESAQRSILLLGHLDTVWPLGTLKTMPCRLAEGRLWGPGTLDMKAGAAMAITVIEMLIETGLLEREIVLLLVSDEEVGSPASRPTTERLATGDWRIEVRGVAAHAGLDFDKGANAILELSRVVETVSGWTDLKRGLTVSVGLAGGGSRSNVVPAEAWAEVDVRVARKADGARMERKFAGLKPVDKRCSLSVTGGINRPPMERTRATVKLFRQAQALAAEVGWTLEEAASGGASDGNITSALGIPTLDGMGAVGEGAHARHESVVLEHLAPRTALLAGLLAQ
jgi:glutamate carboxypeptidase